MESAHISLPSSELPTVASVINTPSTEEKAMEEFLDILQKQVVVYERTSKQGEDEATISATEAVAEAMRNIGDGQTDTEVKKKWHDWAKQFTIGYPEQRGSILADVKKGALILIVTPFAVAGASIFAAGALLYGTGLLVQNLGNIATFGVFNRRKSQSMDEINATR